VGRSSGEAELEGSGMSKADAFRKLAEEYGRP
jgi:hypothetical protein